MIMHEDVKIFFLQFEGNFTRHFFIRRSTHNRSKTRSSTINKFYTTFTEDQVIRCPKPDIIRCGVFGFGIKVWFIEITDGFVHFLGKKGCHAGIQGRCQVWQPQIVCDKGR